MPQDKESYPSPLNMQINIKGRTAISRVVFSKGMTPEELGTATDRVIKSTEPDQQLVNADISSALSEESKQRTIVVV